MALQACCGSTALLLQVVAVMPLPFAGLGSLALVLSIALPIGGYWWFLITLASPLSGYYYFQKGTRKEDFKVCP